MSKNFINNSLPKQKLGQKLILTAKSLLGMPAAGNALPKIKFTAWQRGLHIVVDNRSYFQDIFSVLADLRASDILLENDWGDYPGGGTNHTIGIEAICSGVVTFNAMTKANSNKLADWLGADRLPPFPNWEDENHYKRLYKKHLRAMIYDQDVRIELKRASRQFFEDWLDAPSVVPRILRELEAG